MRGNNELSPLLQRKTLPIHALLVDRGREKTSGKTIHLWACGVLILTVIISSYSLVSFSHSDVNERAAWSSVCEPYSVGDPRSIGFLDIGRPDSSMPGPILERLYDNSRPLPTNSWCQNLILGKTNTGKANKVFQVPYILGTGGIIPGIEVNGPHVQANDRAVMMTYEDENSLTIGAVEQFHEQHKVVPYSAASRLSLVLEWHYMNQDMRNRTSNGVEDEETSVVSGGMRSHIVRGAPYVTMEYVRSSPRIIGRRALASLPLVDGNIRLQCGNDTVNPEPIIVNRELEITFERSDFTWLVFVSKPLRFVCFSTGEPQPDPTLPPGVLPDVPQEASFELRSIESFYPGVIVRVALGNNCTNGVNSIHCTDKHPTDQSAFMKVLRDHADVFPTGRADVSFTFPSEQTPDEMLDLHFDWSPTTMSAWHERLEKSLSKGGVGFEYDDPDVNPSGPPEYPKLSSFGEAESELLMFALPHHQARIHPKVGSTNKVLAVGCVPTLHGQACPVIGNSWDMHEPLHEVNYYAKNSIRTEMVEDIRSALINDLSFRLPLNYRKGAGDTYFSGKMLARLARVLIIANQLGFHVPDDENPRVSSLYISALEHLKQSAEVWLNGSSLSALVYDDTWGGLVGCGCDYEPETYSCRNSYPQCPTLEDPGQNFGSGFYNDHHFHYGYHIYAAAVLAKLEPSWVREYHDRVLVMIRDIANPSHEDPFFPTWRHKDWYLGSSWASGIVTLGDEPYPNGRNQESSAEAIAAYEAVALYGLGASAVFSGSANLEDNVRYDVCQRVYEMGRLLLATEIRSAQSYWHVRSVGAKGVTRIYPDVYTSKVVGMLWSMLAQEQTWFGNEAWKSYGIQLLPITVASEDRDDVEWIREMLPVFNETCSSDIACQTEGWSVLVLASQATAGDWRGAWKGVNALSENSFEGAGGNGHSRSNTLWWIATRPEPPAS